MINVYFLKKILIYKIIFLKKIIKRIVKLEKKNIYRINYIFCNNKYILGINQRFFKKKEYTDTITFNYITSKKKIIFGDIFISIDQVYFNSYIWKVNFQKEVKRVIIHSLLHLLGYNDNNLINKKLMIFKENFYINKLKKIIIKYENI
ncbi:MAG: rRNA maturation RNase YbeY [Candidatus Shikimatogenerans bostrichidophilus]|nr:MAG: rRNA maturation RNase YbeY [Candidatus Shikimatogenerans bostrichidophilus]